MCSTLLNCTNLDFSILLWNLKLYFLTFEERKLHNTNTPSSNFYQPKPYYAIHWNLFRKNEKVSIWFIPKTLHNGEKSFSENPALPTMVRSNPCIFLSLPKPKLWNPEPAECGLVFPSLKTFIHPFTRLFAEFVSLDCLFCIVGVWNALVLTMMR